MGRQWAPHFFCLIWLAVAQIDLRINTPATRARLQDVGEAPDHHRIGGRVKQSAYAALTSAITHVLSHTACMALLAIFFVAAEFIAPLLLAGYEGLCLTCVPL